MISKPSSFFNFRSMDFPTNIGVGDVTMMIMKEAKLSVSNNITNTN